MVNKLLGGVESISISSNVLRSIEFILNVYNTNISESSEKRFFQPIRMLLEGYNAGIRDEELLIGVLLYGIVDNSHLEIEDIVSIFGESISMLVSAFTFRSNEGSLLNKTEMINKYRTYISKDIRVMIIKLLHCIDTVKSSDNTSDTQSMINRLEVKYLYLPIFQEYSYLVSKEYKQVFDKKLSELENMLV